MKRILILTLLMVLTASLSLGQKMDKGAIKEKLTAMEKQAWDAWKNHDADFFKGYLADEALLVGASGVMNKEQMIKGMDEASCEVRSVSQEDFQLVMSGDTAILTYKAHQDATCDEYVLPTPVWATSVYVKRGEQWLSLLYQETPAMAMDAEE